MKAGQYVRCPIVFEEQDARFPRNFILAQIVSINELAETVTVKLHDIWNTKAIYEHIFRCETFPVHRVVRCAAHRNASVVTPDGAGHIVTLQTKDHVRQEQTDEFFSYYVKLSDGRIGLYAENQLSIGYIGCDFSPLKQMIDYEFQHPTWYGQRLRVSQNMYLVDNAVYGFDVLSGCRIFLMEHQITTVVRAFESRPIRYMLADEVGLGKTIEACSIVKIMASENANLRVLYVVPASLAQQWKNELRYKFDLYADLFPKDGANHVILSLEEIAPRHPALQETWDLLVVDETHRLLCDNLRYSLIFSVSKVVQNVLLLSATPIQNRKTEYLNLLRLLLPTQYEDMSLEDFSKLLRNQKKLQRKVNGMLRHMEDYENYREDIYDQLDELADTLEDNYLKKLLTQFDADTEGHGKNVAALGISFITENYRIQRKVIRSRRKSIGVPMGKRTLTEISYPPGTNEENYGEQNMYQALLQYLEEHNDGSSLFITATAEPLLMALFSSPWALAAEIERQGIADPGLRDASKLWMAQGEDELAKINLLLDECPDEIQGRLLRAADYMEQYIFIGPASGKAVVFTGYAETLRAFQRILDARGFRSVSFCRGMSGKSLEDSVYAFQNDPDCSVMICDETGGEGRNFQNADWLIHLDLPWTANAIEQRIGRLDRLGRDADHMEVKSVVLYTEGTIEEQLFRIWNQGMDLFRESLSGLEIITGDLNETITMAMSEDISDGLRRALDEIMEMTLDAKDAVEEEQLYDSGTVIYRPLALAVNNMLRLYRNEEGNLFQDSMMQWATQAGLFPTQGSDEILTRFDEKSFSLRSAMQALFIPPDWSRYRNSGISRSSNSILGTFDRTTAIKREDLLFFAPGDTVFDSLVGNAVYNGRGRCTAFSGAAPFHFRGFAFTYNIGPDISRLLDEQVPLPFVSQFSVYLCLEQIRIFIPMDAASAEAEQDELDRYLTNSYNLRKAVHLGSRSNRDGLSRIERFMQAHPQAVWAEYVTAMERKARKLAVKRCAAESDLQTAKQEIRRLVNGCEAEITYHGQNAQALAAIKRQYQSVYDALRQPAVSLDSICYMRLGD